jgi:2',3'-cyclic-nucleotide 2'-phosphodiesterase (5'-nucleotidase family)
MPFDNKVDILEINGNTMNELLQLIASADGWPIAGVSMQLENGKAVNITIGGKLFDINQTYTLVTTDYTANGGDKANMLKQYEKRTTLNYFLRDAILDYVKYKGEINCTIDGRITRKP